MSRFSVLISRWFGRDGEDATDVFKRLAGAAVDEIEEKIKETILILEQTDQLGAKKEEIATIIIVGFAKLLNVNLPKWLVIYLINKFVAQMKTAQAQEH